MDFVNILLVVAGIGYVMVRRVIGDLVELKSLLVLPAVLTVVGVAQLGDVVPVDATTVVFVAASVLLSVALGLVRGTTVHLGTRNGELWMRYRASTVALWVANIALKGLLLPIELMVSKDAAHAANHAIVLSLGLGILAESAVVLLRAMRSPATVVWEKGEAGRPHRTSPAFDRAREYVANGGAGGVDLRKGRRLPTLDRDW